MLTDQAARDRVHHILAVVATQPVLAGMAESIERYRAEKKFVFYGEMSAQLPKSPTRSLWGFRTVRRRRRSKSSTVRQTTEPPIRRQLCLSPLIAMTIRMYDKGHQNGPTGKVR